MEDKKRGRAKSDTSLSNRERTRRYRENLKRLGGRECTLRLSPTTAGILQKYCELVGIPVATHISLLLQEWANEMDGRWGELQADIDKLKAKERTNASISKH